MEIFVCSAMEVRLGIQLQILVFVQLEMFGMDMPAPIHAVEEEFLMSPVDNVSAHQEIGTVLHVLSVQILKYGAALT